MRKIIFIFIILFTWISSIYGLNTFSIGEKVPNMYISRLSGSNYHNGAPFMLKRDDGTFVYCVNAFETNVLSGEYQEYDYNNPIFNLSSEKLDRINTIAYYGYKYEGHNDIKWYGITQFLIWNELGYDDVYFTDVYHGNRVVKYEEEVNELETLVNNYYLIPNIEKTYTYTINTTYEIIDSNMTLNSYEIIESNIDAEIEDNKLIVNTKEVGNYEIVLSRKLNIDKDYYLYYLENSQSLISPGKVNDIAFKINIEVISGSITINKKDSEGLDRNMAELYGATYGIYKDNILVDKITTNEYGIANISNLSLGKYYVKELVPSLGYNIDDDIYEIDLTIDSKDVTITSYERVIKGKVILNKYYGDGNDYEDEDGAVFEIYNNRDELIGSYETINGKTIIELEYGKYYVVQVKGKDGYQFIDRFNIDIDDNTEYSFDLYNNIFIVDVPNTLKNDYYKIVPYLFIITGLILIFKALKNTTVQ